MAGVDATALRSEFPICAEKTYFNAGTCGPLPSSAVAAWNDQSDVSRLLAAVTG